MALAPLPSLTTPPSVKVLAVVIVLVGPATLPSDTAPVPKYRLCVDVVVMSPLIVRALFLRLNMLAVLLSRMPPFIVTAPVPRAVVNTLFVAPKVRLPALITVPPV